MSETGEPDAALERFSDFLGGLNGGVQVFSLMMAEPGFARELISTMAYAPRLARDLSRQPALLDGMLEGDFAIPLIMDEPDRILFQLQTEIERVDDFELRLNAARRVHREEQLRIGYQLLRGQTSAEVAGVAYTRLADACIEIMAQVALQEVERRFGQWPARWAVCAMGKAGGRELTATSDLDIMVIYDPGNPAPLDDLAPRFTQRLIAALSAPTEEGALYEVDMQLRPSGKGGPVAVKLSAFESYYEDKAWTWEFMALSRLRVVAGDSALAEEIDQIRRAALMRRSSWPELTQDVLDMRRRVEKQRPAQSMWDLKLTPGGMMDVEFVVQHEMLKHAQSTPQIIAANTALAIDRLTKAGIFNQTEAMILGDGYQTQVNLQHALRISLAGDFKPEAVSRGMKSWIAKVTGHESFDGMMTRLAGMQCQIASLRQKKIGPLATES